MAQGISSINLAFPKLGVTRRLGLRQEGRQSEFGTPYAYNTRLEDSLTNRLRGGSFFGTQPTIDRPFPTMYRNRRMTIFGKVITASRVGNKHDTAMSSDVSDMLRPAMFQLSEAGKLGGDVVAMVAHKDQYLLCFTGNETWVQSGDPLNGPRKRVSDQVGIVGANAWCVSHDTVYFLSLRGLYSVSADGSGLKSISEDVIPQDLLCLESDSISLEYDHASRGVAIYLPEGPSWFFDSERGGLWPFKLGVNQSHVLLGPVRIGHEDRYGRVLDIHGNMAVGSSDVAWRIVPGKTAEEAAANGKLAIEASLAGASFAGYVSGSGVWAAGRSHRAYPRTRAIWCCVWLSATGAWAYESASMTRIESGKWR